MKVLLKPSPATPDTEALFREARRRRRNRRLVCLGATLVVLGAILGGYFAAAGREAPRRATSPTTSSRTRAVRAATLPSPEHPYGLAVAPDGTLYVLDTGRDQILRRLASGRFQVFAGNGTSGFSGDGGPAPSARIEIQPSSGIAVASDGAVYFSDSGNGRVREVAPNGIITTVAGGGTVPLSSTDVPAHEATFGPSAPAGLAIGPDGELYIGAGSVYRLTAEGNLQWVVGEPENDTSPPAGWGGVYSNPAIQQDFSPAIRLAFDGRGDLLVAGGGGYGLYEKTTSGTLVFVENFRGDAYWGSLAESPAGNVILSARSGLSVFDPSGAITSVSADLNAPLGRMTGPGSRTPTGSVLSNGFIGGDGVAVAPDGRIYVDTNSGNAFTSVSAIIAVAPTGNSTSTLWRS